jgi:hypothetical protein
VQVSGENETLPGPEYDQVTFPVGEAPKTVAAHVVEAPIKKSDERHATSVEVGPGPLVTTDTVPDNVLAT